MHASGGASLVLSIELMIINSPWLNRESLNEKTWWNSMCRIITLCMMCDSVTYVTEQKKQAFNWHMSSYSSLNTSSMHWQYVFSHISRVSLAMLVGWLVGWLAHYFCPESITFNNCGMDCHDVWYRWCCWILELVYKSTKGTIKGLQKISKYLPNIPICLSVLCQLAKVSILK